LKRSLARLTLAAVALCLPLAAAAAMIVPVSQTRTVSAFAQVGGGVPASGSFSAPDFGPWNQAAGGTAYHPAGPAYFAVSSVRQTSTIEDDRLSSGVTSEMYYAYTYDAPLTQDSLFDVTFDLLEPARFSLVNSVLLDPEPNLLFGEQLVTLMDENGDVVVQRNAFNLPHPGFIPPAFTGMLAAGRYRVVADWNRFFHDRSAPMTGNFDLVFTPIPEPGTALLLAFGLATVAARRRS
jgi:hypothetical protein